MRMRRNGGWVIGLAWFGLVGWSVGFAGEAASRPVDAPRLVPLKYQMQLPWRSQSPIVHELTRSPEVERPPETPPIVMVPEGTINLAAEMPVTASDKQPVIGWLDGVTDGIGGYHGDLELGIGVQWVQIDLRASCPIYTIRVLHSVWWDVYYDVIIQISDDPAFERGVRTVFNNDRDGSSGRGKGTDRLYIESDVGKTIAVPGITGRYVRFYSNGSTRAEWNLYIEAEVYGVPTEAWHRQVAADRAHRRTAKGLLDRLTARDPDAVVYAGGNIVGLTGWLYCDEDFEALAQIPTLRVLRIDGEGPWPRVTPAGAARIKELKHLTRLKLPRGDLLPVMREHLLELPSLEELSIGDIGPGDMQYIVRLKKLRKLDLSFIAVTDAGLAALTELSELEDLRLVNGSISDAGLRHLRKFRKLSYIDLLGTWMGNGVTPAGVEELRRAMPGLQVKYDGPPERRKGN